MHSNRLCPKTMHPPCSRRTQQWVWQDLRGRTGDVGHLRHVKWQNRKEIIGVFWAFFFFTDFKKSLISTQLFQVSWDFPAQLSPEHHMPAFNPGLKQMCWQAIWAGRPEILIRAPSPALGQLLPTPDNPVAVLQPEKATSACSLAAEDLGAASCSL